MKKRHQVLLFLLSLAIITFLDRIAIASAGTRIQDELHIPADRWGWIIGSFVLAYGLFEVPTGALGDRLGQRRVLTRIVLWWSAFTSLTGAAMGFFPLLAIRFLFGRDNPNAPLYVVMLGGVSMLVAAACVALVREVVVTDVPEPAVLRADAQEMLTVPGSVQPVPSTGLVDRR